MYNKTVFANGVRVVSEKIPGARTVSFGIWVDVGSRDEDQDVSGISHFVEHMFFKGTASRSAQQISRVLDSFGGMANAFTSKDTTCLYCTVLDSKLPELIELFADMFHHSQFDEDEVGRECQVILQEISMVEDIPEEQVHEIFEDSFWGEHSLARPVLGDPQVVDQMNRVRLQSYVEGHYAPGKVVISCAGNVEHHKFCQLLEPYWGGFSWGTKSQARLAPVSERVLKKNVVSKDIEQVQLVMGAKGLEITSDDRFALVLLNTILGGNMSSRLFQEIREKRGLAYSISSYIESYIDCGYVGISCGVAPASVNETLALINEQLLLAGNAEALSQEEMHNALDYTRGSLYLAAENLESRMTRNARNELYFERHIPLAEVVSSFEKVTVAEIAALAGKLFADPLAAVVMGPVAENEVRWP
ncbi:MAG: insulinase family protein [Proteobacteria bacterium]|nr:insulinase family protein [Pseudomonadota bacterium]MBU1639080.1 insulinase family protein [Pseudomonadota bacterium]